MRTEIGSSISQLDTPAVVVDLGVAERNAIIVATALAAERIAYRPHVKAHKCSRLTKLQLEAGASGITAAKLGEAEVMAAAGIDDILVAYPLIGAEKLRRYAALLGRGVKMRTVVNSLEGASGLSELGLSLGRRLEVLVELDGGINRGGVKPGDVAAFGRTLMGLTGIAPVGVMCYSGDIYSLKTESAIRARVAREVAELRSAAAELRALGFDISILSGGSSFSVHYPDECRDMTESRAGNCLFNDLSRLVIGLVAPKDCALSIITTVVGRPDAETAIIDAGSKTLTCDTVAGREGYGMALECPDAIIYKLNEEHGYVRDARGLELKIGDKLTIIPNHACVIPNLTDEMYGVRGGIVIEMLEVDARGKNR